MDMLRTLLIYLSATMTLAVQSTSAPVVTPTPSPAPTAVAEAGETPAELPAEEAVTPEPQATEKVSMTPFPVPTITPNTRAYHNLGMGAKGKEVTKLQEKLIGMGYLPEGSADGAYGRKTYNAVKKFQYYNGLRADGIAGRATQTNLFENPDIVPNPELQAAGITPGPEETPIPEVTAVPEITDTPAPTETPTPEVTEEPTPEPTEEPTPEPTEELKGEEPEETEAPEETEEQTEEPEVTEEPEKTEAPEATAEPETTDEPTETEEQTDEVIENVDLDADVYEEVIGKVALNESSGPLEFVKNVNGVPTTTRPRLTRNGVKTRVSLDDLCQCVQGWQLTDDGVGSVVLEAAGYTLALYNEDAGASATVDGTEIPMKPDDFDFNTDGHFINAEFLAEALKGEAIWVPEESTLMLRIRDKIDENADG